MRRFLWMALAFVSGAALVLVLVPLVTTEPAAVLTGPGQTAPFWPETLEGWVQVLTAPAVLVALIFAGWRAWIADKQAKTAEQGQVTERFTKAVEQLGTEGDDKVTVRLGGIYALARIAQDSPRDHWTVMEVLRSFVREKRPLAKGKDETQPITMDVQTILTVLERNQHEALDLSEVDLYRASLRGANLCGADLHGTDLYGANLARANLRGANLRGANLCGAHLRGANLCGADLTWAILSQDQTNRRWEDPVALRMNLVGANFSDAILIAADLRGTDLRNADLRNANLLNADLSNADLSNARNLTPEQLYRARGNVKAKLPDGFRHPWRWLDADDRLQKGEPDADEEQHGEE